MFRHPARGAARRDRLRYCCRVSSIQVNSVDLLWNSILSSMTSGKTDGEGPGEGEGGVEGQEELAFGTVDGLAVTNSAPAANANANANMNANAEGNQAQEA